MCHYGYHHYTTCGHIANFTISTCIELTNTLRNKTSTSCTSITTAHDLLPISHPTLCLQCEQDWTWTSEMSSQLKKVRFVPLEGTDSTNPVRLNVSMEMVEPEVESEFDSVSEDTTAAQAEDKDNETQKQKDLTEQKNDDLKKRQDMWHEKFAQMKHANRHSVGTHEEREAYTKAVWKLYQEIFEETREAASKSSTNSSLPGNTTTPGNEIQTGVGGGFGTSIPHPTASQEPFAPFSRPEDAVSKPDPEPERESPKVRIQKVGDCTVTYRDALELPEPVYEQYFPESPTEVSPEIYKARIRSAVVPDGRDRTKVTVYMDYHDFDGNRCDCETYIALHFPKNEEAASKPDSLPKRKSPIVRTKQVNGVTITFCDASEYQGNLEDDSGYRNLNVNYSGVCRMRSKAVLDPKDPRKMTVYERYITADGTVCDRDTWHALLIPEETKENGLKEMVGKLATPRIDYIIESSTTGPFGGMPTGVPVTGGLFGSSNGVISNPRSNGPFGGNPSQGTFGSLSMGVAMGMSVGGLFGSHNVPRNRPQANGSLFRNTTTPGHQGQGGSLGAPIPIRGGVSGSTANTGGLFGGPSRPGNQGQRGFFGTGMGMGGGFGRSMRYPNHANTGGLFGSPSNPQGVPSKPESVPERSEDSKDQTVSREDADALLKEFFARPVAASSPNLVSESENNKSEETAVPKQTDDKETQTTNLSKSMDGTNDQPSRGSLYEKPVFVTAEDATPDNYAASLSDSDPSIHVQWECVNKAKYQAESEPASSLSSNSSACDCYVCTNPRTGQKWKRAAERVPTPSLYGTSFFAPDSPENSLINSSEADEEDDELYTSCRKLVKDVNANSKEFQNGDDAPKKKPQWLSLMQKVYAEEQKDGFPVIAQESWDEFFEIVDKMSEPPTPEGWDINIFDDSASESSEGLQDGYSLKTIYPFVMRAFDTLPALRNKSPLKMRTVY